MQLTLRTGTLMSGKEAFSVTMPGQQVTARHTSSSLSDELLSPSTGRGGGETGGHGRAGSKCLLRSRVGPGAARAGRWSLAARGPGSARPEERDGGSQEGVLPPHLLYCPQESPRGHFPSHREGSRPTAGHPQPRLCAVQASTGLGVKGTVCAAPGWPVLG